MSVRITGGSADQQNLITQGHAQAISMASAAQTAAQAGGATFTTWFGTASTSVVAAAFGAALDTLNNYAWTYDATNLLDMPAEGRVYFSPVTVDTASSAVTLAPWKAVFLQATAAAGQRMAALSVLQLALEVRQGWTGLVFVESASAAQRYAAIDPAGAAACPRNYMEYAGAVTP